MAKSKDEKAKEALIKGLSALEVRAYNLADEFSVSPNSTQLLQIANDITLFLNILKTMQYQKVTKKPKKVAPKLDDNV